MARTAHRVDRFPRGVSAADIPSYSTPHRRPRRPPIRDFVKSAIASDFARTTQLALSFLGVSGSRLGLYTDLFQAAQQYIEELWHVGRATVADEYRVYTAVENALAALPTAPDPQVAASPRILLATLEPEHHDLGLRLVAGALAEAGWRCDLRMRITGFDLVAIATRGRYSLVGVSATYLSSEGRARLAAVVASLQRLGIDVLAGGSAFVRSPLLAQNLGIEAVATDARFAVMHASWLARQQDRRRLYRTRTAAG